MQIQKYHPFESYLRRCPYALVNFSTSWLFVWKYFDEMMGVSFSREKESRRKWIGCASSLFRKLSVVDSCLLFHWLNLHSWTHGWNWIWMISSLFSSEKSRYTRFSIRTSKREGKGDAKTKQEIQSLLVHAQYRSLDIVYRILRHVTFAPLKNSRIHFASRITLISNIMFSFD